MGLGFLGLRFGEGLGFSFWGVFQGIGFLGFKVQGS